MPKKKTKTPKKSWIVYPEGDFDLQAIIMKGDSAEEVAKHCYDAEFIDTDEMVCVMPFEGERVFHVVSTIEVEEMDT